MRKLLCIFIYLLVVFLLCACSADGRQAERETLYDIIESGNRDEILSVAEDAKEKSDVLYSLSSDFTSVWKLYEGGNKTLDELDEVRKPLIDFLISEGYQESEFAGSDEEITERIYELIDSLYDEYIAINKAASEIMKQEAVNKLTGNNN